MGRDPKTHAKKGEKKDVVDGLQQKKGGGKYVLGEKRPTIYFFAIYYMRKSENMLIDKM